MKFKIAELLLRRKQLNMKVDVLQQIKDKDLFEVRAQRKQVTDNIDDIIAQVPKLTAAQVTAEYDFYSKQLRLTDAMIQQSNWTTEVDTETDVMADYAPPKEETE